jgi:hypothetical protein
MPIIPLNELAFRSDTWALPSNLNMDAKTYTELLIDF